MDIELIILGGILFINSITLLMSYRIDKHNRTTNPSTPPPPPPKTTNPSTPPPPPPKD